MAWDFATEPEFEEQLEWMRGFVRDEIYPLEPLNLEDETGLLNVVCSQGVWARHRRVARASNALLIRGRVEKVEGVINFIAERIEPLTLSSTAPKSRDFR